MSNVYSLLSTANTFGDWIVTTNALTKENNDIAANNYVKPTGTLYLNDPTTGLQVNATALFYGTLHSVGSGSSTLIDNNLTVGGNVALTNTQLSMYASGNVALMGANTGLYVANNANIQGNIVILGSSNTKGFATFSNDALVTGNLTVQNNFSVTHQTVEGNVYVIGSIVGFGNTFVNAVQANSGVNTSLLTVTGNVYANAITSNTNITTANGVYANTLVAFDNVKTTILNVVSTGYMNFAQANSGVNTAQMVVTNGTWTNTLQANTSVNTAQMVVTNGTWTNTLQANVSVNTSVVNAASIITNTLQANTSINTASLFVTNNISTANIVSTGNVWINNNVQANSVVTSKFYASGLANTVNDLGVGGNLFITNNLNTGGSLTAGSGQITGNFTVGGNFTITGSTVYNTNKFIVSAATPNQTSYFGVYRTGTIPNQGADANSYIQWNQSSNVWAILNVQSGIYNQITTNEQLSTSGTDASTFNVSTSYALSTANTFLQANDATTLASSKTYANTIVSANLATAKAYTDTANTFLQANDATTLATAKAYTDTANTFLQANDATTLATAKAYTDTANTFLQANDATTLATAKAYANTIVAANVVTLQSQIASNVVTIQGQIASNISLLSSSANASNLITGTIPAARLPNSGVTANTYGSTTQIPVLQIDATGRVTTASNTAISTTLPISGNTGTGSISLLTQTLNVNSSNTSVITTSASGQTITISPVVSGVTAGSYGSVTAIPVLTVDTFGRVQSLTTSPVSTTGTGNTVLSISPTLITPNIGTPSSGNLVNCTISAGQISTSLGYVPYNASNPNSYINIGQAANNNSWTPTGGTFNVTGNITASNNITAFSDKRLKSNITTITGALDIVNQMRGVKFDKDGQRGLGVIAQEVQQLIPEVVFEGTDENKTLSVAYGNIVGLLIEAIKELKAEIDELKKK